MSEQLNSGHLVPEKVVSYINLEELTTDVGVTQLHLF